MEVLKIILCGISILAIAVGILAVGYFIAWLITPKCLWDDGDAGGGL